MNVKTFQAIATALLQKHFGLELGDTNLTEVNVVQALIEAGHRPFEVINETANDCDLTRIDVRGPWGIPQSVALVPADEMAVLNGIYKTFILGEEIPTCPDCGSRTDFDELSDKRQHHVCLNRACRNEFFGECESEDALACA